VYAVTKFPGGTLMVLSVLIASTLTRRTFRVNYKHRVILAIDGYLR